ncbi:2-amino-4-hydroxy-6-hydroxymethyldihydropteridine diphosphokinase [Nesterenkonia xinjiangensis]|uniref:Bifunctional folate synthesis protein n=1 Tax=Nesterenkonia xinjiangensis TaxID=225327 RepID=A0A7Z0K9W6_9MICC|nr:2-amino-4-hydroxy-6-hydroxymethyldihydropteridine diphosphokinase [Nesterenkonia xinjiangensis]NYJ78183.1 dihydroneopterin aldolase/2-amino-4-hydroxy-6-hydroxymethyldihydropteridine diphosphokinase [Nesterenkonia xinjiangensis]
MRSDTIRLTGISAVGHHGVFEFERRQGQPFRVDAELDVDLRVPGRSDAVEDTVSYVEIAERIEAAITGEPYDLIEALAQRIAADILAADVRVTAAAVTVHKPQAPLEQSFADVSVTVHRTRAETVGELEQESREPRGREQESPAHEHDSGRILTPTAAIGGYDTVPLGAEPTDGSTGRPRADQLRDPDLPATFPVRAVLALGSNLGDSAQILDAAVVALEEDEQVAVVRTSPRALTAPVGGPPDQPDFLNQVVEVETSLSPHGLLDLVQRIEAEHHRTREIRWGPRTLDVDVITYAGSHIDSPRLTVPHPRAAQRAFVLLPWSWMDPIALLDGVPVRELAAGAADVDGVRPEVAP